MESPWGILFKFLKKIFLFFFLVALSCMRDLSSPPGDWTQAPCSGSAESQLLDHQEGPWEVLRGGCHQCALGDSVAGRLEWIRHEAGGRWKAVTGKWGERWLKRSQSGDREDERQGQRRRHHELLVPDLGCLVGKLEEEWVGEVMGSRLDVLISGDLETHDRWLNVEISFSFFFFYQFKICYLFWIKWFFVTRMHVQSHSRALTFLVEVWWETA